jgi:hypothetical protein
MIRSFVRAPRTVAAGEKAGRHPTQLLVMALEDRQAPAVLTVNSLVDGPVSAVGSVLTLRDAVALVDSRGLASDASGKSLAAAKSSQINLANPFGTNDVIQFASSLNGPNGELIILTNGSLVLNHSVTIDGGANNLAVSGDHRFTVFKIAAGSDVTFSDLTITGGLAASAGGGIDNFGTVTLVDSAVSYNSATQGSGGGIANRGALTLDHSTVAGNLALNDGGIYSDGTLRLTDSTVSGNTALEGNGGMANYGGQLLLVDSTVSGNTAKAAGGIGNYGMATATLVDSVVTGNSALNAGGILNTGTIVLTDSTVSNNAAVIADGGIANDGALTLAGSDVSGNSASAAGGIGNYGTGTALLLKSEVTGNLAPIDGAIHNDADLSLVDSSISGNVALQEVGIANNDAAAVSDSAALTISVSRSSPVLDSNGGSLAIVNNDRGDSSAHGIPRAGTALPTSNGDIRLEYFVGASGSTGTTAIDDSRGADSATDGQAGGIPTGTNIAPAPSNDAIPSAGGLSQETQEGTRTATPAADITMPPVGDSSEPGAIPGQSQLEQDDSPAIFETLAWDRPELSQVDLSGCTPEPESEPWTRLSTRELAAAALLLPAVRIWNNGSEEKRLQAITV